MQTFRKAKYFSYAFLHVWPYRYADRAVFVLRNVGFVSVESRHINPKHAFFTSLILSIRQSECLTDCVRGYQRVLSWVTLPHEPITCCLGHGIGESAWRPVGQCCALMNLGPTSVCGQHSPPAKRLSSLGWTTKFVEVLETSELVSCFIRELKELDKEKAERCCENVDRSCGVSFAVPCQLKCQNVEQSKQTSSPCSAFTRWQCRLWVIASRRWEMFLFFSEGR